MRKILSSDITFAVILVFFFSLISYYYGNLFNLNRHWSSQFDQELVIAYNALLFNSAVEQDYTDHSAFFTILSSSIYLKILNLFNQIDIYKFSQINNFSLDEIFQTIIPHLRFLSLFINAFSASLATFFFYIIFRKKILSIILGLTVFYLYGNFATLITIRSEQFSILFLFISLIALNFFFTKNNLIYLIIFFFSILCSILNKSQVIFYIPAILLFSFYFNNNKKSYELNFLDEEIKNKIIIYIFSFFLLFLSFKSLVFGRDYKTWVFLIITILIINYFFLKISNAKSKKNNIILFNFALIIGYIFFQIIVFLHPSSSLISLNKTIFSVINNTIIYNSNLESINFFNLIINVFKLILSNSFQLFKNFFLNINAYLIIFLTSIILFLIKYKDFSKKEKKAIFCIFAAFIYICEVNYMRGSLFFRYNVYVDYLPVLMLGYILNKYNFKKYITISIFILACTIYINNSYIKNLISSLPYNDIKYLCNTKQNNNYFGSWIKKIPSYKFKNYCEVNYN